MDLCHTVILKEDYSLAHAVSPLSLVKIGSVETLFLGAKLSFCAFSIAALREKNSDVGENFALLADLPMNFVATIVDDMERKPLLKGHSSARALYLLGELLDGVFESAQAFGIKLKMLSAEKESDGLSFNLVMPKGSFSHAMLGSAICFISIFDYLLFARGLSVSFSKIHIDDKNVIKNPQFLEVYKTIFSLTS